MSTHALSLYHIIHANQIEKTYPVLWEGDAESIPSYR